MTRPRKVRWSHRAGCGHYVTTGQVTISRDGGRTWTCRPCALAAIKTTAAPAAAPPPTKEKQA
jgi:hypothetical protein